MPSAEPRTNPLAARRRQRTAKAAHPMKAHAAVWRGVNAMGPDDISKFTERTDYALPILGELAGNPDVTAKDVIKASSQAAADGKISPTEAVQLISQMPEEPDKLQGWLKGLYALNMTAAVHLKAAQMRQAQPQAAPPQPAPAAPEEPPPTTMTPGEAA